MMFIYFIAVAFNALALGLYINGTPAERKNKEMLVLLNVICLGFLMFASFYLNITR